MAPQSDVTRDPLAELVGPDRNVTGRKSAPGLLGVFHAVESAAAQKALTMSEPAVRRLVLGRLPNSLAAHVRRLAGIELYQLFDDPDKDARYRSQIGVELEIRYGVPPSSQEELMVREDLTLREANQRKSRALVAWLTDTQLSDSVVTGSIERLGRCGSTDVLTDLRILERSAPTPEISEAVSAAIVDIQKAASMTIVFVSMEVNPQARRSGLGDVMRQLPRAIAKLGHQVIVITPRHAFIDRGRLYDRGKTGRVPGLDGSESFRLLEDHRDGVEVYFVENDRYFSANRAGIYGDEHGDYSDNPERYDFFGAAVPVAIRKILGSKMPDIVQLNDAHTAPAAVYVGRDPAFRKTKTIMGVQNLGGVYQGKFDAGHLGHLRLDDFGLYYPCGPAEFYGQVNLLKLGLTQADATVTVGREYAKRIVDEEHGEGLHGVLNELSARRRLWGNLNGIDDTLWNPVTDGLIPANFSFKDQTGKQVCKAALQSRFGLPDSPDVPLIGVLGQLSRDKGLDDVVVAVEHVLACGTNAQFVICGCGDPAVASALRLLARKHPVHVAFDGDFASPKEHLIYAGTDFLLMPSVFEPCGQAQMLALRYLSVPIVRAVGGLRESVQTFDDETGAGNGFDFVTDVRPCMDRALKWYAGGARRRQTLLRNCAASDFSWERTSAVEQLAIYRRVIEG